MKPALTLIILLVPLALGQSPPAVVAPDTGVIEGTVVSISGEPLRKADLHLRSASAGGTNYTVSTDAQGRFVLEAILAGRYRLSADHGGYLQQFYGDRSLQCCGQDIALPPGGRLENLVITLTPQAAISGKILDEDGDPMSGVVVSASRIGYLQGQKMASVQGSAVSNPDGTFTIWNLRSGRYSVSAEQRKKNTADEQTAGNVPPLYLTTYFLSTSDEFSATPIVVAAGAEVRGIDIRLMSGRKYQIRGKLTGLPERFSGLNFVLDSKAAGGRNQAPAVLRQDGSFAFSEVIPGDYILRAQTALGGPVPLQAYIEVSLTDRDLEVEVPLTPAAEIAGTVKMLQNDTPAVVLPQPVIILVNPENLGSSLSSERTDASGSFRIRGILATRYRVSVASLPPGVLVRSIRFEGQDITHEFLDLTSGAGGNLEIVLSPTAPDLTGAVRNEDGAVIPGATVSVWKAGEAQSGYFDPPSEVRADANGQFQFQNLAPGEYLIGAWEELEPGLAQVPEFRSAFESAAVKVKLDEGGNTNIDLKVFSQSSIASALGKLP